MIECARLAPRAVVYGTDLDPQAIAVAASNFAAAGLSAAAQHLQVMSCLDFRAASPTLTITNPPMGKRVHRGTLEPIIVGFVEAWLALAPAGGRLVWLSPLPQITDVLFSKAGCRVDFRGAVDLGGFEAQLEVIVKLVDLA